MKQNLYQKEFWKKPIAEVENLDQVVLFPVASDKEYTFMLHLIF
jgi:hypothetical protein